MNWGVISIIGTRGSYRLVGWRIFPKVNMKKAKLGFEERERVVGNTNTPLAEEKDKEYQN